MNQRRSPIAANEVPNTGYRHTRLLLNDFTPASHWIVIKEDLEQNTYMEGPDGMVIELSIPDKKYHTLGTVLSVGPMGADRGIRVGDKVVYEQWQGGKWAFTIPEIINESRQVYREEECLIMSCDSVWCIIRD